MKNPKQILLMAFMMTAVCTWAQGPNNSGTYYQDANGKSSAALREALRVIINPHTSLGYDGLFEAYESTDKRADGYVRDWYSNVTSYTFSDHGGYSKEGDCYNREHSVPQSWFTGASQSSLIKCDVVHVIPTDGYINNMRSNLPFGEVSRVDKASMNNYSKKGSCGTTGYSGTVFEPNDEIKGDMARIYFYMATCYANQCNGWGGIFNSTGLVSWHLDMMMRWAKQDPIDAVEIARNNAVYQVQKNRNPFVDYPGLEEYIWGSKTTQAFSYDNYDGGEVGTVVATPVFRTEAGTYYNKVEVTITCQTPDAEIRYTTDGSEVTSASTLYDGPVTLTQTATVKARAFKGSEKSSQVEATYTVIDGTIVDGTLDIALNNGFFNCSYNGSIQKPNSDDLTGTLNGLTVVYALGTGSYRYCNGSQIRIYPGNTLTLTLADGTMTGVEIICPEGGDKLMASAGTLSDCKWTGNARELTFTYSGTSGHTKISALKVTLSISEVEEMRTAINGQRVIYNLRGQRVTNPTRGIYIVDGKKVVLGR